MRSAFFVSAPYPQSIVSGLGTCPCAGSHFGPVAGPSFPQAPLHFHPCNSFRHKQLWVRGVIGKQPSCPMTEEWVQKMWFIYTMEYYSVINNKDILTFAGNWMELENIILSEVTQTQKDLHGMYSQISTYLLISQTNKQAIKQYRIPKIQSTELKQVNSILKRGKIPLFKS